MAHHECSLSLSLVAQKSDDIQENFLKIEISFSFSPILPFWEVTFSFRFSTFAGPYDVIFSLSSYQRGEDREMMNRNLHEKKHKKKGGDGQR